MRRSAIERLGWNTYIRDAGMTLVASRPDPGNPGAELGLYGDVPGNLDNPIDAAAWTYGLTGELYATLARRT